MFLRIEILSFRTLEGNSCSLGCMHLARKRYLKKKKKTAKKKMSCLEIFGSRKNSFKKKQLPGSVLKSYEVLNVL